MTMKEDSKAPFFSGWGDRNEELGKHFFRMFPTDLFSENTLAMGKVL